MKIKLDFEVDEETIKLVSQVLKKISSLKEDETNLTEHQKFMLSDFALSLLMAKNEQAGHNEVSPITESFLNYLGAELVIQKEETH